MAQRSYHTESSFKKALKKATEAGTLVHWYGTDHGYVIVTKKLVKRNPSIRTGKFKGGSTYYSGGPKITRKDLFRGKARVDQGRGIRYMVGFNEGNSRDYINAKKLSTAKAKGEAYAKHRGWSSFWVQNQVTASILNFQVVPRMKKNPLSLGLPRNKWVNARVRVTSSGKIQAQVSENVLGSVLGKKKNKRKVNRRKRR